MRPVWKFSLLWLYIAAVLFTHSASAQTISYAVLCKKLNGGYYTATSGVLNFRFEEEYYTDPAANALKYVVYDNAHQPVSSANQVLQEKQGDNRFSLTLPTTLVKGTFYLLEVSNRKGEKWYLRFTP